MLKLIVLLASSLFSSMVLADEATALAGVINQVFDVTTGLASNSPYVDDGKKLFSLCLLIAISWAGIKTLVDDSGFMGGIAHLIRTAIIAGMAAFFMQTSTLHSLVKGFDYLGQKAVAATGSGMQIDLENPAKAMVNVAGRGMTQVFVLWNGPADTEKNQSKQNILLHLVSSLSLDTVLDYAMDTLAKIGLSILSLVSLLFFLLSYFTSQMMVNIGLIFAPLFVPWLILESTSFLFHGWLKFVIVAGVQKMVGALLFALGLRLMDSLPAITTMTSDTSVFTFFPYAAALLLTLFMLTLQWQGASIASGLVSGMPSTSMMWPRIPQPPKTPKQNSNNGGPSPGNPPGSPPQRPPSDPNRFNPGGGK